MATMDLNELLEAAGGSLGDAQGRLLTGVEAAPTRMAIAEATLEMKLTIDSAKGSALKVVPVTAADARAGALNVGALSSVTMRFMALGSDVPGQVKTAPAPETDPKPTTGTRRPVTRAAAEKLLLARGDIARRIDRGEALKVDTLRIGTDDALTWIVTARDAAGRTVGTARYEGKP